MSERSFAAAFVDELVRAGVRDAVICPGSDRLPWHWRCRSHRPALPGSARRTRRRFFAIGLAKASGGRLRFSARPGTAGTQPGPAVTEALQGRVSLIVLTADRPPELRDRGAAQTIDQMQIYEPVQVVILGSGLESESSSPTSAPSPAAPRQCAMSTRVAVLHFARETAHSDVPLGPLPGAQPAFTTAMVGKRSWAPANLAPGRLIRNAAS